MELLISVILVLAVVGFILYLVNNHLPAPSWIKMTINFLAVIFVVIWLLRQFGGVRL